MKVKELIDNLRQMKNIKNDPLIEYKEAIKKCIDAEAYEELRFVKNVVGEIVVYSRHFGGIFIEKKNDNFLIYINENEKYSLNKENFEELMLLKSH